MLYLKAQKTSTRTFFSEMLFLKGHSLKDKIWRIRHNMGKRRIEMWLPIRHGLKGKTCPVRDIIWVAKERRQNHCPVRDKIWVTTVSRLIKLSILL